MYPLRVFLLIIPGIVYALTTVAQNHTPATQLVWKKRVSRLIDTRDSLDTSGRLHKSQFGDSLFARILMHAVMKGTIPAHGAFDEDLDQKPNDSELKKQLYTKSDTLFLWDNPVRYSMKYRVTEDWTYDPSTRETQIQIVGMAPMAAIYGDCGLRGHMSICIVPWNDLKSIIKAYSADQPNSSVLRYLWDDHFKYPGVSLDSVEATTRNFSKNVWKERILRDDIELLDTFQVDDPHFMPVYGTGWNPTSAFYDSINKKKIVAYSNTGHRFTNPLSGKDIKFDTRADTQTVEDVITGETVIKYIRYDLNWDWFHNYTVMEEWTFNVEEGKTSIRLLGIQPRLDRTGRSFIEYSQLFWVRYWDAKGILDLYDQQNPLNNLGTELWRSYFYLHRNEP